MCSELRSQNNASVADGELATSEPNGAAELYDVISYQTGAVLLAAQLALLLYLWLTRSRRRRRPRH